MTAGQEIELTDIDLAGWQDYALDRGWSDGLPVVPPSTDTVDRFVAAVQDDAGSLGPIPPREMTPVLRSLAANAVMAGAKPEYFGLILAALQAVLAPGYRLRGSLATTHPCAPVILVNGPVRKDLEINCRTNCMGQGSRANLTIGRALQLILQNIGGAVPGVMDHATHGSPAKLSFCFGENEEESPWEPYHVRRGYDADASVVTVMSAEPPHNINDHASTTSEALISTVAYTACQPGSNQVYRFGPFMVALSPEHAQTAYGQGRTIESLQSEIFEKSKLPVDRVSDENRAIHESVGRHPVDGHYYLTPKPEDIQIVVAGGSGKQSVFIPSFGNTIASAVQVAGWRTANVES